MTEPGENQTADVEMVDADAAKVVVVDDGAPAEETPAEGETPAEETAEADADAAPVEPKMVPPEVKPELMDQMVDMGFSKERSLRAIHFSGNSTLEGAMNWLDEHQADADIDEPLLVPEGGSSAEDKKKLTPEEAKAKAAELQAKAKAKREAAEKVTESQREKMRINMGKEMAAAHRQEQETKLARMAAERKREKDEMEAARAKLKVKMEEDRRVRRRKQGLPEELTPEELEEERRKAEEKAAEAAKKRLPMKPVSRISKMREILVSMKKAGHEEAKFQSCCKTLTAYCRNVYANLSDDSKRKINCSNKAFQERVAVIPGGVDFLNQVGFQEEEGFLVMQKVDTFTEKALLEGAGEVLSSAMTNPMFGVL